MAMHLWSIHAATADAKPQRPAAPAAAYGSATLCWLLSAGVYIAARSVAQEMPPWSLCFWRVTIAALILLPLVRSHYGQMAQLVRGQAWSC
jgi:hypothetical protein